MATTADILPLAEKPEERIARLASMAEEYGEDILTAEEADELYVEDGINLDSSHYANLAEQLSENTLSRLAQDVIEWVDRDEESRKEWYERERRGMQMMGVIDDTEWVAPFHGAASVTHPVLAEAVTAFQARAISEMWPAQGPVRTIVMGKKTPEVQAQAQRVADYMNWQYTQVNGGFDEEDRMLMRLPLSGSCFKKQYFDPQTAVVRSDYVDAVDFLVPYQATSLATAVRYTHRMRNVAGNDIRKLIHVGYYRDATISMRASGDSSDMSPLHEAIDEAEGRQPVDYEEDGGYTLLECACYLDLEGLEDLDEAGNPTGIALPYVVTVEKENQVVLSIRRGWKESDPYKNRRVQVTHYRFLPGFGFYGFGYIHIIGGLSRAATGALRAFLDAAGLANTRGGFRSRDAKLKSEEPLGMGEWRETDMSAEELSKCFFPMDYREPSTAMFQVLGYLDELGRRYSSTTETLTGDANNNGPVGTTLALIEQGLKVFSAIHKRLHEAHAVEFRIMADLYGEYVPDQYPYLVEDDEQVVLRADFDDRVDVLPVSDPNVVSSTQRIAQAQGVVELSGNAPGLYDLREVHRRMLTAMRVENIDALLPPPQEVSPMDPVTEGANLLKGEAVQAYPEQDHLAHMMAHRIWWDQIVPEDMRKDLEPTYKAHMAEHLAELYKIQVLQGMDPAALQDPQVQDMVAQQAANVTQLMAPDSFGLQGPESSQEQAPRELDLAKIEIENAKAQAQIEREDAKAMAQIDRDDAKVASEMDRAVARELESAQREADQVYAQLESMNNPGGGDV